jgi:hypothetical protein
VAEAGISRAFPAQALSAPTGCFAPGSSTISDTATARVFSMPGNSPTNPRIYGCLYRVNRPFRLVFSSEVESGVDFQDIEIADPYVGFGFTLDEASGEGSAAYVRVLNLMSDRRVHNTAAAGHFFSDVTTLS